MRNDKKTIRMTTVLRKLLSEGLVCAPGCFDAFSARLAELAGFKAIHLTGMGIEITQLGAPDLGLMTMTELSSHAARISSAINIPIICDVDTGFGGILNINRTILEMERAGVAGVHIEDQVSPKHCPLLAGRNVLPRDEAVKRVKAAVNARTDPDFIIVARSDADVISYEELVTRSKLYLDAGADMVMPVTMQIGDKSFFALPSDEQMELLVRLARDVGGPIMGMGSAPPDGYTMKDMENAGFSFVMYAGEPLSVMANALTELYKSMLETGNTTIYKELHPGKYYDPLEMMKEVHLSDYTSLEKEYV